MTLFRTGLFRLHSGQDSDLKIDCDALTEDDWTTLARIGHSLVGPFGAVQGVPEGGLRFAKVLSRFSQPGEPFLLADDVLTTGESMETWCAALEADAHPKGLVVFARSKCPTWITPIFQMTEGYE